VKTILPIIALFLLMLPAGSVKAAETAATGQAQVDGIFDKMVDHLWYQTDIDWKRGDYPRIIALDRIIVLEDPHFVECYNTGAWLMESLGRHSDAEAFDQQALQNNPSSVDAYLNLGMFYTSFAHDYAAAEAVFRKCVAVCPDAGLPEWKMIAHCYERENMIDDAVATWQEIKRRYPNGLAVDSNLNGDLAKQRAVHAHDKQSAL